MSFIVNFCFNWDGGGQERDTAVAAVKAVFPDANVTIEGSSSYPIQVSVVRASDNLVVWKGSQKKLFKKSKFSRGT